MFRRHLLFAPLAALDKPAMRWADPGRLGRPYSKDPSVIRYRGRYLLYYSLPGEAWGIGVAESRNLVDWAKTGEVPPVDVHERKGICAPCAKVIGGEVHLFYQTYGNGRNDAICHAVSKDGLQFRRNPANPIFRPTGDWNAGRAIDAEIVEFNGRGWLLYAATRDPAMKVQMVVGAAAASSAGFAPGAWKMLADQPLLKPELPWERDCIEAPSIVRRGDTLYMFYAGGYNNAPQQIGCARSADGVRWQRLFTEPLLRNGPPGAWNESESGHPAAFVDDDGQTYLFYQGNNDRGRTWYLSFVKIAWRNKIPYVE